MNRANKVTPASLKQRGSPDEMKWNPGRVVVFASAAPDFAVTTAPDFAALHPGYVGAIVSS